MDIMGQQKSSWLITFILKIDKSEASKEDNPDWSESTTGLSPYEYWKATKTKIATLESMGAWESFERYENMHVIQ